MNPMTSHLRTKVNGQGETVVVLKRPPTEIDAGPLLALIERLGLSGPLLEICREHNVLLEEVLVGMRTKSVVLARERCVGHLRSLQMSYVEVAKLLGMDHTTAIAAARRLKKRLETNGEPGPKA